MKCKKCETELEEGVSICPECGFDNSEAVPEAEAAEEAVQEITGTAEPEETAGQPEQPEMKPGLSAGKVALLVVLAVAATAVVVALIVGGLKKENADPTVSGADSMETVETTEATVPADGNPDDATCKGTYYVTDEELKGALDTVVATAGDLQLTNAELQVYYWMSFYDFLDMYGNYLGGMGFNPGQSLDTQMSIQEGMTWQQFLLQGAIENWRNYSTLAQKAETEGHELNEELKTGLENLPEELLKKAQSYEFETAEDMIRSDMGNGATMESYMAYMNTYYRGYDYYSNRLEHLDLTDEMIENYFDEHASDYEAKGLKKDTKFVDARHILIIPEGGTVGEDGRTKTYSEEEWEAARVQAQDLLDQYLAGDATEEAFAALASEHSQDPGSQQNGGLYSDMYEGQMVKPFEQWCFDDSRVQGDTGLVKTDYGYHIMYYVSSRLAWPESAKADLTAHKGQELLQELLAENEMTVDYGSVVLGRVDPNAK